MQTNFKKTNFLGSGRATRQKDVLWGTQNDKLESNCIDLRWNRFRHEYPDSKHTSKNENL